MPGAQTAIADITQPADRTRLLQAHGDISILVNNAGIQINRPLLEQSPADIRHELETNLAAPVLLTHAFLPALLRQRQAAIVNVSSGLAIVPKEAASIILRQQGRAAQFFANPALAAGGHAGASVRAVAALGGYRHDPRPRQG